VVAGAGAKARVVQELELVLDSFWVVQVEVSERECVVNFCYHLSDRVSLPTVKVYPLGEESCIINAICLR
jgi:hypothetical protein